MAEEQSSGSRGDASRLLRPLAVGAAVAATVAAGLTLLERRRASDGDGRPADAPEPEGPADLATELRGAAGDVAVTLLDRVTDRLERAKL